MTETSTDQDGKNRNAAEESEEEQRPYTQFVTGTVIEIYSDGQSEDQPFRALLRTDKMGGMVMLVSDQPIAAQPGDDLLAHGYLMKADDAHFADELHVALPHIEPNLARLRRRSRDEDSGASYAIPGAGFGVGTLETSPAVPANTVEDQVARLYPQNWKNYRQRINRLPVTVMPAPQGLRKNADALLKLALDSFDGVPQRGSIVVIDSQAFPHKINPGQNAAHLQGSLRSEMIEANQDLREMLIEALPVSLHSEMTNATVHRLRLPDGRIVLGRAGGGNVYRASAAKIVMLPDPYESGASYWSRITRLPLRHFAPQQLPSAAARYGFQLLSLMARAAVPVENPLTGQVKAEDLHMEACLADGYAVLRMIQTGADKADIEALIAIRRAGTLLGSLTEDSGDAMQAALEKAEALQKSGDLEKYDTLDLLRLAEKIAIAHYRPQKQIEELAQARMDVMRGTELRMDRERLELSGRNIMFGLHNMEVALETSEHPLHKNTVFSDAFKALKQTAQPLALIADDPVKMQAAMEDYAQDMADSTSILRGAANISMLLAFERSRLTSPAPLPQADVKGMQTPPLAHEIGNGVPLTPELGRIVNRNRLARLDLLALNLKNPRNMVKDLGTALRGGDVQNHIAVIRHARDNSATRAAFALSAEERLQRYQQLLAKEAETLKPKGRGKKADESQKAVAEQISTNRAELAFALRSDLRSWTALEEQGTNPVLLDHIIRAARGLGEAYCGYEAKWARQRLIKEMQAIRTEERKIATAQRTAKQAEKAKQQADKKNQKTKSGKPTKPKKPKKSGKKTKPAAKPKP